MLAWIYSELPNGCPHLSSLEYIQTLGWKMKPDWEGLWIPRAHITMVKQKVDFLYKSLYSPSYNRYRSSQILSVLITSSRSSALPRSSWTFRRIDNGTLSSQPIATLPCLPIRKPLTCCLELHIQLARANGHVGIIDSITLMHPKGPLTIL
jgi:hypothetical protein